jgi:hypothetical protein
MMVGRAWVGSRLNPWKCRQAHRSAKCRAARDGAERPVAVLLGWFAAPKWSL